MLNTTFIRSLALGAPAALLCGATLGCVGIDSGISYPDDLPSVGSSLISPENTREHEFGFSRFKISPEACKGLDTHAMTQPINQDDFARFLEAQGVKIAPKKARSDLYWFDFPKSQSSKSFLRLRVAILPDQPSAAKDLHSSLLDHGPGWWGVRRSNVAILAPRASLSEAVSFAIKYKLACWGEFTYAGNDDAYVVPGPYAEF